LVKDIVKQLTTARPVNVFTHSRPCDILHRSAFTSGALSQRIRLVVG